MNVYMVYTHDGGFFRDKENQNYGIYRRMDGNGDHHI
jgi:hypothetical protein